MQAQGQQRRLRERLEMPLPVRVHCRESADHGWVEKTKLMDITPFGARLALGRPTEPGRLLHLTMPLPRQLRCFDYTAEQYNIWALVRHARALPVKEAAGEAAAEGRLPRFVIGVAFIGKHPPLSFEADPAQRFKLTSAPADEKLWITSELPDLETVRAGERRTEPRLALRTEVVIEVYDAEGNISAREVTLTENISRRGMSAVTSLDIMRGRYVRVRSARHHIAVIAAVRRLRRDANGHKRLHLEFVDQPWPTPEEG